MAVRVGDLVSLVEAGIITKEEARQVLLSKPEFRGLTFNKKDEGGK